MKDEDFDRLRNAAAKFVGTPPARVIPMSEMTLRDHFAAKAPLPLEDAPDFFEGDPLINWSADPAKLFDLHARLCYEWADAMLKARR